MSQSAMMTRTPTPSAPADWQETWAYALGIQAYTYGYSWVYYPKLRWQWTTQPVNPDYVAYMPLNTFWHARHLITAAWRQGGGPNNDTLYSFAWVNLGLEPMILSHPDMGDRYFTFECVSFDSDNFAYVGKRATGSKAGHFALVGPNWKGTLPQGITPVAPATTPWTLIVGRTLVEGEADLATVHRLQDQYRLTPLSAWGKSEVKLPEDRNIWQPGDPATDPLADWKTMNRALAENPPDARDAALLEQFATIGVGPGLDVERMDAGTKRGLARAAAEGRPFFANLYAQGGLQTRVNGWNYLPRDLGRAGQRRDYLTRGALQCATGIAANDLEEAVYLPTTVDVAGERLSGERRYRLRFAPGALPPVNAFWSLTMYGMDMNLVDNPINRYSIGDRTPGLMRDADGGLTLYIQRDRPEAGREANWLPAPEGLFNMVLRCYLPAKEIIEQTWMPPAPEVVR